jgi:uncharacterized protein YcaQ
MPVGLDELRRHAVARSLFAPTSLKRALRRLGFVQADPIRAPARAQDLTMRHRAVDYRAGDLERRYADLEIEEDFFINYGFVTSVVQGLMHPRRMVPAWPGGGKARAARLLEFVRERGAVHPREAHQHFAHGTVTNYWGGASNATTHWLDGLHYRGLLRVAGRRSGIRLYAAREPSPPPLDRADVRARIDALIDVVVGIYAPLPRPSLSTMVSRLRYAVPQWQGELRAGLGRALQRLGHSPVGGVDWYWPQRERPERAAAADVVRLLSPFDPVVWDRRRFELLWGWPYRFEAYTPVDKRKLGYYALPLLWRDDVVGWANVTWRRGELTVDLGFVGRRPAERAFTRELDAEIDRMRMFLSGPPQVDH